MKRIFPYLVLVPLLCSCSVMGPAFTGGVSTSGFERTTSVRHAGHHCTPAEDPATGLYGYINDLGMWVIPPKFDAVQNFGSSGLARVRVGNRYGAIDPTGQWVIPAVFSTSSNATAAIQSLAKGRLPGIELWAERDPATGLFGYLDHYGRWAIAPQYRNCGTFGQQGIAVIQIEDGHWGAIDRQGAMVVQPRFNNASDVRNAVQRLGRY